MILLKEVSSLREERGARWIIAHANGTIEKHRPPYAPRRLCAIEARVLRRLAINVAWR